MKTSVPFPSKTLMKPLWGITEKFRDFIEFRFKPLSLQTDRKWKPRKGLALQTRTQHVEEGSHEGWLEIK